jgi:hypothetical protein
VLRNAFRARAFDCVVGEALPRQVAGGLGPRSAPGADPGGADGLRLERRDRRFDRLPGNAARLEVVPDEEVARTAAGEGLRPGPREALVVDSARVGQARDRLRSGRRRDLRTIQARIELCGREVTAPERTGGPLHRLVSLQLAAHPAGALAVDLDADVEAGPKDDFSGQRPPRLTVERDVDAPS